MTGGGGHEALDLDLVFSVLENIVWGGQVLRVLPTDISSRLSRPLSATISTLHTEHGECDLYRVLDRVPTPRGILSAGHSRLN